MDRNTIIGLLLIGAILIGFGIYNSPSTEEIEASRRRQDSLALVEKTAEEAGVKATAERQAKIQAADTVQLSDSAKVELKKKIYGNFAEASEGESKTHTIENELIKVSISNKGGRVTSVELKNYKTFDQKPLILFDEENSKFGLNFSSQGRNFSTDSLYFKPEGKSFFVQDKDSSTLAMRLYAGENKYIEYLYSLKGNSYLVNFTINSVNLNDVIAPSNKDYNINWWMKTPVQEQSLENQQNATTVYYKVLNDEVDYLSDREDEKEKLESGVKWVALKQQFFTSVLIAGSSFEKSSEIETKVLIGDTNFTKELSASLYVPYGHKANESFDMSFYFGPNHYQTLKKYDLALEKQIPLGWGIFGWVNRFLVIPVFNFLNSFDMNYGVIIFILTILIKLLLFPLTYKAYLSTAKMKVLKPEMDEINEKFKNEDPLKKQQAVMALYRQAGVNPMGGCLPMLLQMPILIAMFNFFPSSIELRQESFLWANDLSTYDSIWDLGFNIPLYGDHVSLFTLLMTVSTILYTRTSNQMSANNAQMEQMKWIMYLMPIVFLGVFNNYSAGLSYYYFLANMITFGQQYAMRQFVNEDEIHRKIQENKKRPAQQTKSKFQQRLEDMAKQRQEQMKKKK